MFSIYLTVFWLSYFFFAGNFEMCGVAKRPKNNDLVELEEEDLIKKEAVN